MLQYCYPLSQDCAICLSLVQSGPHAPGSCSTNPDCSPYAMKLYSPPCPFAHTKYVHFLIHMNCSVHGWARLSPSCTCYATSVHWHSIMWHCYLIKKKKPLFYCMHVMMTAELESRAERPTCPHEALRGLSFWHWANNKRPSSGMRETLAQILPALACTPNSSRA